jgi:4-hydroxy-L-threonine phosphate dehydrogenase PdxA
LLGLNPHAGEKGIIGSEEGQVFSHALSSVRAAGMKVFGPLSPDAAFMKENWKQYSLYVCCYHDQGLIPFKMIHGQDDGVHVTVGLPFIRTSVDHGTAKDIFGKNRANPQSMLAAIKLAADFAQGGA